MRGFSIVVAACIVGAGVAHADGPPQTENQKKADALFAEGRKLIDAHDDAGACAKFGEAIKLDPDAAGTMLNLGLCNQNLKKYRSALYWFRKAQARAHETSLPEYEKAAGEHTTQLASLVATVKVVLAGNPPADAKVKIDGEEVRPDDFVHVEVDPGHHALDAGANGFKTEHQEFDVVDKGGQTLTVQLVAGDNFVVIDRGAGRRKAALITAIGGGVLLLASTGVSLYAKTKYGDCLGKDSVPPAHCPRDSSGNVPATGEDGIEYANHYHNVAAYVGTPLFVAGAVGIAVGAYLYFTAPQRERVDRTVLVPMVGRDQAGLAAVGQF